MKGEPYMFDINSLRAYIAESGIKQKVIARKAGINESAFSLIMTGKRKCSAEEYARICFALGVPAQTFIRNDEAC